MKQTVTSGLCYIEDLIFLENKIVWFWNSSDVLSTDSSVELFDIFSYSKFFFLTTFRTSFWKRVHNSKEIVNIQGLFVLIVCYLFISTFSFLLFLYTVSWRYKRDYLHASIDVFFISCSILSTWWRNIRLKKGPDLNLPPSPPHPQPIICSYAPEAGSLKV